MKRDTLFELKVAAPPLAAGITGAAVTLLLALAGKAFPALHPVTQTAVLVVPVLSGAAAAGLGLRLRPVPVTRKR